MSLSRPIRSETTIVYIFFFTTSSLDFPALKWRPPEFASVLIDFFSVPLFFAISQSFIFVFGSEAPIGWHENRF